MSVAEISRRIAVLATCAIMTACGSSSKGTGSLASEPESAAGALNTKPVISGTPVLEAQAGIAYEFVPEASDADGDTLTFHIENRPDWATFSPLNGKLAGTPSPTAEPIYLGIVISVTDGRDTSELAPFDLSISGTEAPAQANSPPVISGTPEASIVAGNSYEFLPEGSDPDGQTLTYRIDNSPGWAQFDEVTGRLWGTPTSDDIGLFENILITVSDGLDESSLPAFSIEVTAGTAPTASNRPPSISGSPAEAVAVGQQYMFLPDASDPDGQALTFSITNRPNWATFSPKNGRLSGTPSAQHVGTYEAVTISVSDGAADATLTFTITVIPQNNPPRISGTPASTVEAGQPYQFLPSASDADGDSLSFSVSNKPGWASFNLNTGLISGTPTSADVGTYSNIVIAVTDGAQQSSLAPFTVQVTAPNRAPTISGSPVASVTANEAYNFLPSASDPDGDALSFSISGKPSWATFNGASGRLTGTPTSPDTGTYSNIRITVSDGQLSATLPAFSINVTAANRAPTISGSPAGSVTANEAYSFTPNGSDPDGDSLTFSISGKPAWASFNTGTGRLNGTPSASDTGTYSNIRISVSDGQLSATLPAFSINVTAANRAPTISGSPAGSVTANEAYSFTPNGSDPDGDSLTFSISGKPAWASFNTGTGRLNGTPSASDTGTYSNIRISVSDGQLSATLPAFSINVTAANRAPTISGSPAGSVTANEAYSFTPNGSDPDGDSLSFSISGKPAWASFNTGTGRLNGTPSASDTGTYSNIRISVSDGQLSATLPAFSINVTAANQAPTISGSPAGSVTANEAYSFTPNASDPDGDSLSFSISGKPAWASFNTGTGRLNGTPSASDTGTYSNIRISVSDGQLSATLPAFSISVQDVQLGSATLSWTPPTQNEDGSPLTDLKGYRIQYGKSAANLDSSLEIPNPGISSAVVENLSPATWYFAVKAYNDSNVESALSNVASKAIN